MRSLHDEGVPLNVLVVDAQEGPGRTLQEALEREPSVLRVALLDDLPSVRHKINHDDFNAIFIDPLSLGLDASSSFVFRVRKEIPEIVFVLYVDRAETETRRSEFYRGERRRFSHYLSLDKQTPVAAFAGELRATLARCQTYFARHSSASAISHLRDTAGRLASNADRGENELLNEVRELLVRLATVAEPPEREVRKNSVFLSHRFAEEEYVTGLSRLLEQNGFEVVIGRSHNTYVSQAILERIRECEYFFSLMTRDQVKNDGTYSTSPWLLEEKGAALALGKTLILMVEEGVTDVGGLQGDWQRIHFGERGFLSAALEAVEQLKSYSGGS